MIATLENEHWRLQLLPRLGASPMALQAKIAGVWQDIMRPTPEEILAGASSAKCSSYTLAPWSNRIPNGEFWFNNQMYTLRINIPKEQTARHGDVQDREWQIERTSSSLICIFDSDWYSDINFPFAFTMKVTHTLEQQTYRTTLELTNISHQAMPAGFGIHPYFLRRGTTPTLRFNATGVYVTDETNIPNKAAEPIPTHLQFQQAKQLEDKQIDHVFNDWDGKLEMAWQDCTMHMTASQVFSHLVVFTGAPDQSIALEPVTHATNAFNLAHAGIPNIGHQILEPNQTLRGEINIWLESQEQLVLP